MAADHQFALRDGGFFYYPLYQRVQQEWEAGRIPLWEMEENAGMPLLGNPSAAVLYPGKVVYGLFPYPWAARFYVVGHVFLAFVGQSLLLRSWGVSQAGAALAGLAYAFGAPVVFQYCNIIFLVGAAWAPWGFRAADRMLRLGSRFAIWELGLVLVMETLGGDPEIAYLTVAGAAGYAVGISLSSRPRRPWSSAAAWWVVVGTVIAALLWGTAVVTWAYLTRGNRPGLPAAPTRVRIPSEALSVAVWGLGGAVVAWQWWRERAIPTLGRRLLALFGAAALALGLSAAQLLPSLEFTAQSVRAVADGPHAVYPFSVEPWRVIEWIWPNVFGPPWDANQNWLEQIPPKHKSWLWAPSLYLGSITLALAVVGAGFRSGPPWRAWMTAAALISFVASAGEFASPLWWGRSVPKWQSFLGDHDPTGLTREMRSDGALLDGDGSPYWLLMVTLPGFGAFRYPGKLLTLTTLALSALAGAGWDKLVAGRSMRAERWSLGLLALTLVLLTTLFLARDRIVAALATDLPDGLTRASPGRFDAPGAVRNIQGALNHGALAWAAVLALVHYARRRPRLAAPAAMVVLTLDMAIANQALIVTVPQSEFDRKPKVLELIEQAERKEPAQGPFRIHRPTGWSPARLALQAGGPEEQRLWFDWHRSTLTPKVAIPYGLEYTFTSGTAELADYSWFFVPFTTEIDAGLARRLHIEADQPVVYYPRRGFDIWNTRYFILPMRLRWDNAVRGFMSLLEHTQRIVPEPTAFSGPEGQNRQEEWAWREDWTLSRNEQALPRAWVVHRARRLEPNGGQTSAERRDRIWPILYPADRYWNMPGRPAYDPREVAWVEADDIRRLRKYIAGGRPTPTETVSVHYPNPQRVEIEARLEQPGLVILADVFYPGWKLQIDGHECAAARKSMR